MSGGGTAAPTQGKGHLLDTRGLLWGVFFLAVFAMAARVPASPDMWWHLRAGEVIARTGQFPYADLFSHTVAGKPWTDVYWLPQVVLYGVYAAAGLPGLMAVTALAVTLAYIPLARVTPGNLFVRAFALLLAAIAAAVSWVPRPQMVTFAFLSVTLWVLARFRQKPESRLPLVLIPLFALWANSHGGFPAGLICIGCAVAGWALERLVGWAGPETPSWKALGKLTLTAGTCLAATLCNPYTYRVLLLPFQTVGMQVLQDLIQEWAAPDFHLAHTQPFLGMLLLTVLALALSPRRPALSDLVSVCAFTTMALMAGRNISLAALVLAPVLSQHATWALERVAQAPRLAFLQCWGQPRPTPGRATRVLNAGILCLLAVAALGKGVYVASVTDDAIRQTFPVGAARFIRQERLPREMFNPYNWGGFLVWELYPDYPVFVDGRTDLYDDPFLRRYLRVVWGQPGWEEVLREAGVHFALVEAGSLLDQWLGTCEGWRLAYRDDLAAVWVRSISP
ncbi:MAG: hypothetical protein ACUVXG_01115 [Anaerolineae bacterium]